MGYTLQHDKIMRALLRATDESNVKCTDGTLDKTTYSNLAYAIKDYPAEGIGDYGIVVGTDDTTPTPTDYKLGTKIAHGTAAGDLQHGTHTVSAGTTTTKAQLSISRPFTNSSGSDITVKEVALYVAGYTGSVYKSICVIRGLKNFTIPAGETKMVEILLEGTA